MKILKYLGLVLLLIISMSAFAARDYIESGRLQCSIGGPSIPEVIVLYVNGINTDLVGAEKDRKKLEETIRARCQDCDFKKVYNQNDGLYDIDELTFVGEQEKSILKKVAKDEAKKWIREFSSSYSADGSRRDLIYNILWMNIDVWGIDYNPSIGLSFSELLIGRIAEEYNKEVSFDVNSYGVIAFGEFAKFLNARIDYIDMEFRSSYMNELSMMYLSNYDLYKDDTAAAATISKSVDSLTTVLKEYALSGRKVVVVAHSQGNHIIELAYANLMKIFPESSLKSIRVVGVASVASTTPSGIYVTLVDDSAVLGAYRALGGLSSERPLEGNFFTIDVNHAGDENIHHSFVEVYLSDLSGKYSLPSNAQDRQKFQAVNDSNKVWSISELITELVVDSIDAAEPGPNIIATDKLITAQLTWKDYGDMDLHIQEPSYFSYNVYYGNKIGTYGYLDLDDVDGDGPEHYYVNYDAMKCMQLDGRQWNFGVQQYPNGGAKAQINLMIKVGDTTFLSRSFGQNSWGANILPVGSVKFTKGSPGNLLCPADLMITTTMCYTITITDPGG